MAPIIKSVPAAESVNPSQQNNVFQFVQDTKPTERSAGVALVAGDRWYKPTDGTFWFWNGTYWLSSLEYELATMGVANISATTTTTIIKNPSPVITSESNILGQLNTFVTRCLFYSREMATNDESNYWANTIAAGNGFGAAPNISPIPSAVTTIGAASVGLYGRRKETSINLLLTAIPYGVTSVTTKVGSPSNLTGHFIYLYRSVYI